jgi:hypothetical protein
MINNKLNDFYSDFKFNITVGIHKDVEQTDSITQIELMKLIHEQFQIPAIKKLYPNPKWTERVFWVIHGNIYHQFEDLSMDRLSEHIEQYITEHGYSGIKSVNSQRDTAKLIIDAIKDLQVDGKTKYTDLSEHVLKTGITADMVESTMKHLKRDGRIFEPSEGFYRCV